jgi:hypothetical protein
MRRARKSLNVATARIARTGTAMMKVGADMVSRVAGKTRWRGYLHRREV